MEGRVVDESEAPMAGVTITLRNVGTGLQRRVITKSDGRYRIERLSPGTYAVTAEVAGFVTVSHQGVAVPFGSPLTIEMSVATIEELLKIQVKSASKLDQRTLEAPSVVDVVTREQIDRYGWLSLNEILYKQPGFGPAQDYDRRTVASRGLFEGWNNNHLLHLVDGIPFNDNLYGSALTWEITPLFMARTVEVLRGPGSALYGSYAVNGVVQVNTVSAGDLEGKNLARATIGDAGVRVYDSLNGYGAGNLISAVVGYNSYETDGNEPLDYDGSGLTDSQGNLARSRVNDRRSSRYFWAKLEGSRGLQGLGVQYHDQYWKFQTGHGWLWWTPDFREGMEETRRILSLSYEPATEGNRLSQEYLVRFQRHDVDWNTRYYPNGARGGFYPAGMWEYLDTRADDVFGRAQFSWKLRGKSNLLLGLEGDRFSYKGDREHDSNVNVGDSAGFFPHFPDNRTTHLGPWLDYIDGHPLTNVGVYGQLTTKGHLSGHVDLTLGARHDRLSFDYTDIRLAGRPLLSKDFSRFSPRIAVIVLPTQKLSIKLMAGRAFRAPAPTELAGAHTFSLASNIDQLRPEVMTTGEIAADWVLNKFLNLRSNLFVTKLENEIAYSAQNMNLSTNIYTLKTAGLEAELLFEYAGFSGFLNYSHARRLDEKIIDSTIAPSPKHLTWDPANKVNFGVGYVHRGLSVGLAGHYQGTVDRRASDVGTQTLPLNIVSLDVDLFRPRSLGAWFTLDGKVGYRLPHNLTLALLGTNVFDDGHNRLVKNLAFPFDYLQEGRRYRVSLTYTY